MDKLKNGLPCGLILLGLAGFFYFHLNDYFDLTRLRQHHQFLSQWVATHYFQAVIIYIGVYICGVAISIPGKIFFNIVGGFLFGMIPGMLYAVCSATIGSTILFIIVRKTFSAWFLQKSQSWIDKLEKGFQANAFNYLLMLRLLPVFPFFIVNIVAGLLSVRLRVFISATCVGIIPSILICTLCGEKLNSVVGMNQTLSMNLLFQPDILLALSGLSVLAILPVIPRGKK